MVYQGKYYLDAASTTNYGGFTFWNWRGSWQVDAALATVRARDEHRSTRGMPIARDFAFGSYRYFPGTPRQAYLGFEVSLGEAR